MSKSDSPVASGHEYYECGPCGYAARVDHAIGLCPVCGDSLAEKSAFD